MNAFREFYYLKEELVQFCRENGLPVFGGKLELTKCIFHFLDTGKVLQPSKIKKRAEPDLVCSEKHREFFAFHIGKSFTFNAAFQKWLK